MSKCTINLNLRAFLHHDAVRRSAMAFAERTLVVADTLPVQIDQMKEGLSPGQVGQRPFEMGYKTMFALRDIKDGKAAPTDPTYCRP